MGFIIAFSGVDGSGKTTTTKLFINRLRKYGFKATYRHEFDFILLKPMFRLFAKLLGSKKAKVFHQQVIVHTEQNDFFHSGMYYLFLWLDSLTGYLYSKLKRGVIVFDRCIYDYLTAFEYRRYENRFLRWCFLTSPRPDIVILLNPSPETAQERKKGIEDRRLDYYKVQKMRYLKLARKLRFDKVINSDRPFNEVLDDVMTVMRDSSRTIKFRNKFRVKLN